MAFIDLTTLFLYLFEQIIFHFGIFIRILYISQSLMGVMSAMRRLGTCNLHPSFLRSPAF